MSLVRSSFQRGNDLYLEDDFNTKANNSRANFPCSYNMGGQNKCVKGQ